MKIDLHCHTRKIKDGDPVEREISPEEFNKKMIENEIKIVAITNHNCFDIEQYKKIKELSKNNFKVWPGIEWDINENGNKGHAIVICNPKNYIKFSNLVLKIINGANPNNFVMSLNELYSNFKDMNVIFAFHYNKEPDLSLNNIRSFEEKIKEKHRVFYEPTSYRKLGILTNKGYRTIIGSDVRNWENYSTYELPNLKLDVESFEQFLLLAKKDYAVVETMLNKKNKVELQCSLPSGKKETIPIFDDVNVIFGAKGTGKSEILKQINIELSKMGKNISYYEADSTSEKFNNKLKVTQEERIENRMNIESCETEIERIKSWKDVSPTSLKDYIDYIETENVNTNKKNLKIVNITEYNIENDDSAEINDFFDILNDFRIKFEKYSKKYLKNEASTNFQNNIDQVINEIKKKRKEIYIDKYTNQLYNFTIEKMKELVDMKTGTKSKPTSTNFLKYAINKLKLYKDIVKIDKNFKKEEISVTKWLGKLDEKKEVFIECKYKILENKSVTSEFKDNITDLKKAFETFKNIKNNIFKEELYLEIENLKAQENITTLMQFVGISKNCIIKKDDGQFEKYTPSKGEETMLILQERLNEKKDVYILDEPEKSLGNSYINDVIVPIINNLANMKKTIVIATHNANIAVRTLPYTSVYKEYNGNYLTYIGNPFTDKLINIKDTNDTKSWKEMSLKCLEGGDIAFDERGEIYGRI